MMWGASCAPLVALKKIIKLTVNGKIDIIKC